MNRILVIVATLIIASFTAFGSQSAQQPLPWLGVAFKWTEVGADRVIEVANVTPGSPAERAGIRGGDIISSIGNTRVGIGDELDFLLFVAQLQPNDRLEVSGQRRNTDRRWVIKVGTLPEHLRQAWQANLTRARRERLLRQR